MATAPGLSPVQLWVRLPPGVQKIGRQANIGSLRHPAKVVRVTAVTVRARRLPQKRSLKKGE